MPKKKAKVVESIASSSEDEWEDVAESCEPAVNNDSDVQVLVFIQWKALFHRKFLSSFLLILTQI